MRLLSFFATFMLIAVPALAQENQQEVAAVMRKMWAQTDQAKANMTQQVYSRTIAVELPRPFVAAFKQASPGGGFIMEYVPDGETLTAWTQMITVTGSYGIGSANVDDAALASYVFGRSTCPGKLYRDLGPVPAPTSVRQRVVVIGCDGPDGSGERAAIAFLRDADHVWTVQFAQRAAPGGRVKLFDIEQAIARLATLNIRAIGDSDTKGAAGKPQ